MLPLAKTSSNCMLRSEGGLDTSLRYVQGSDLQWSPKKAVHRIWAAAVLQEPLSRCQLSLSRRKVPAESTVSSASCPKKRRRQNALGAHKQQLSLQAGHRQGFRHFFLLAFSINGLQGGGESLTGAFSCHSRSTQGRTSAHPNGKSHVSIRAAPIMALALSCHCHSEQLRGSCQK